MIGGIVTEVFLAPDRVWINCEEERSTSRCAIYVRRNQNSEKVRPGDKIWWQGRCAMWTPYECKQMERPRAGIDYDIRIPRIGFSGVNKPCGT